MRPAPSLAQTLLESRWLLPGLLAGALVAGWLVSRVEMLVPEWLFTAPVLAFVLVLIFKSPRLGVPVTIFYCFTLVYIGRHLLPAFPLGIGIDALLTISWIAVAFQPVGRVDTRRLDNDLCWLTLGWFGLTVVEIANPAGASLLGWVYEMRSTALYWLLSVPLACLLFYRMEDLRLFLKLIIGLSVVAALYGIKQKFIGVDDADQKWLDEIGAVTHIIWGKLRIFSFYMEAAQFGASQAHIGLICLILALGPFAWWKRALLLVACLVCFYGMLISGTRGAFFVVFGGIFLYLVLSRQLKPLLLGGALAVAGFCFLKYTSIGSGNADIVRFRTALDPNDPSLQLRLMNQAKLSRFLVDHPFGGGVGTIGVWGQMYNQGSYLSTIAPDSYFVKIWAEYGIVGFIIWFGIMLYILGKCCGIVWNLRDPKLRQMLLALTAGFGGVLLGSYGNEVMNQIPSCIVLYVSWALIFQGPALDAQAAALSAHD